MVAVAGNRVLGMSFRSVILGLLGAAGVCAFTYFNDFVIRQSPMVGHHMPNAIFGSLILFVVLINPLIGRFHRRGGLTGAELAVVLVLTLSACTIPSTSLMRNLGPMLMIPHHHEKTTPGWAEHGLTDLLPDFLLAETGKNDEALTGFIQGQSEAGGHISLGDIPWYAWKRTLAFWLPFAFALWLAVLGLSLVLHIQWARNEKLTYPIAEITSSFLPDSRGRMAPIYRDGYFVAATIAVALVYLNNFAAANFPNWIGVKLRFDMAPLVQGLPPEFVQVGWWPILRPTIAFSIIGIAYFMPREIALSLGIGPYLFGIFAGILTVGYGVDVTGGGLYSGKNLLLAGIYLGLFSGILFTGRYYYANVALHALGAPARDRPAASSVWGARVFMAASIVLVLLLVLADLDWQLALLFVIGAFVIYVVMSRILAETGLFANDSGWFIHAALLGLMGAEAVGPKALLILGFFTTMFFYRATRESLMPYVVNGLKLVDLQGAAVGKTARGCVLALIVGLAVAVPVSFFWHYDGGLVNNHGTPLYRASVVPFRDALEVKQHLEARGLLEESESLSGWSRFLHLSPDPKGLVFFLTGLTLVSTFTFLRLRLARWPLHPVLFATWVVYPVGRMAVAILIGAFIKECIMKYGGVRAYDRCKPIMIGLVAGEILGRFVTYLISLTYYLATGESTGRLIQFY